MTHKLRGFLLRFGPGLVEQGCVSALNFASVALAGRFLDLHQFAVFVSVYAAITFPYAISGAAWGNIALILMPKAFPDNPRSYAQALLLLNAVTVSVLVAVTLAVFHRFVKPIDTTLALSAAAACFAWSSYDCRRRLVYAAGFGRRLLPASLSLTVTYLVVLFAARYANALDARAAFLSIAAGYTVAALLANRCVSGLGALETAVPATLAAVASRHWSLTRWILAGNFAFLVGSQGYFFMGGRFLNDGELGGLRASHNLLNVVSIFCLAYENQVLPLASAVLRREGVLALHRQADAIFARAWVMFLGIAIASGTAALLVFPVLYGHKYPVGFRLLPVFAVYQLILLFVLPLRVIWDSQEKFQVPLVGHLASALVTCTLGLFLTLRWHALGAALGIVFSSLAFALVLLVATLRQKREVVRAEVQERSPQPLGPAPRLSDETLVV